MTERCVVFIWDGGDLSDDIPDLHGHFVIAADSGLATASRAGVHVDLVIGDMDSVALDQLAEAESAGAEVERHPAGKDKTDLELALDRATHDRCTEVLVIGGAGGRADHALANLTVLASAAYADMNLRALLGPAKVAVIRAIPVELRGEEGDLVSLFALGRPARGIRTTGLRYALDDGTIDPSSSLGVSNVFTDHLATVSVAEGVLLAVQPGRRARAG